VRPPAAIDGYLRKRRVGAVEPRDRKIANLPDGPRAAERLAPVVGLGKADARLSGPADIPDHIDLTLGADGGKGGLHTSAGRHGGMRKREAAVLGDLQRKTLPQP